jgi:hypothetical protein
LVIDSRAARVLVDGRRDMIDEDEWDSIVNMHAARSTTDRGTTLPLFMHGIHHLEVEEAICDGRWGSLAARSENACGGCRPRALAGSSSAHSSDSSTSCAPSAAATVASRRDDHHPQRRRSRPTSRASISEPTRAEAGQPGCLLALPKPTQYER